MEDIFHYDWKMWGNCVNLPNKIDRKMIRQSEIALVIDQQAGALKEKADEVEREQLARVKHVTGFASIITGLRRVGKSTLLRQIARARRCENPIFLNFDDIRLNTFEADDFNRLYNEIKARKSHEVFFDEIQIVKGWEIFVSQLLRERFDVWVSGSNASMLSVDLGTHLTGRHLQTELLPFSYTEYLELKHEPSSVSTFDAYLQDGGIPDYVKTGEPAILSTLLEDVLVRDIAINKHVSNIRALKQLAVYLLTNVGKLFSGNRLRDLAGVSSATTVNDYVSFMRDAYLLDTIGLYSDSMHVTTRNAKKVYAYDTGLAHSITLSRTADKGRLLENAVFVALRREHPAGHIFYDRGKGECDFVVTDNSNTPCEAIQVCYDLNSNNYKREIDGLTESMSKHGLHEGIIVTSDEEDQFNVPEGKIRVVKAWQLMSQ